MYILGISCYYHDSSAALIKDGKVITCVAEERFTRVKHDTSFPINAIKYCLELENITSDDLDYISFYEKPLLKFERILYQHISYFPRSLKVFLKSINSWTSKKLKIIKTLKKEINYCGDVLFVPHHYSHGASFFASPFESAVIVNIDGVGEFSTTSFGIGCHNKIVLDNELDFPHSLGLLYSSITAYLGFSVNNSEYKVMGLSSYGEKNKLKNIYYKKLLKVIDIKPDGSFCLDLSYFKFHYSDKMPSKKLCNLLGGNIRKANERVTKRHMDIAAAIQTIYEDVLFLILNNTHKKYNTDNLILSGGCALNSVANGKILQKTNFKSFWILPDPGDGGASLGCALFSYYQIFKQNRTIKNSNENNIIFENPFLGPNYSNSEIKFFLDSNNIKYSEFETIDNLLEKTSKLIYDNKIVSWFQGRMEFGPRALGSRSILANPCNPNMKEILNKKVKLREEFRPFAPVVCSDDAKNYFDCDENIPKPTDYMLLVYPVKKEYQKKLPSITHVDGSGRLQTIERNDNEMYYDLIKYFGKLSGIPILINTSFNIRGEPIVCSPEDAYNCMMGTKIDYLVIGKYLVSRKDNL
jgi:carbamoyltransferase